MRSRHGLLAWTTAAGVIAPAFVPVAGSGQAPPAVEWHHDGMFMGLHWLWWVFWAVAVVALIWGIARAVSAPNAPPAGPSHSSAEEVLRERFARGDLSEEEFKARLRALRESVGAS